MRTRWWAPVLLCAAVTASGGTGICCDWLLPVKIGDRQSWDPAYLTSIGAFGLERRPRLEVDRHLHTGIDIARPSQNHLDEPVYPASCGVVISVRDDGPFAQVIVEHACESADTVWTVYEHLAGLRVTVGDSVRPAEPLGRLMSRTELDRYGHQFDHVHFEIMKSRPRPLGDDPKHPRRFYGTYSLECHTKEELDQRYHNPAGFLIDRWEEARSGPLRAR